MFQRFVALFYTYPDYTPIAVPTGVRTIALKRLLQSGGRNGGKMQRLVRG
jgi:hypothetical protein